LKLLKTCKMYKMTTYEEQIFKTLTINEENLTSAIEISEFIPKVKGKLISDFWIMVKNELDNISKNSNFKVFLDEDILNPISKLYLYKNDNHIFRITYEHLSNNLSIGLWIWLTNCNQDKTKEYKSKVVKNFEGWHTTSDWWLMYKDCENFSLIDTLIKLIQSNNVENFAKIKAQELFDFATENENHLNYMIENCSNK